MQASEIQWARLVCRTGATGGTRFDFVGEATLGRDPGSTVTLGASEVSSHHARIVWDVDAGCYQLEDLGSLNGTELDGRLVRGSERLGRMHVITLGGTVEIVYQGPELCADAGESETGPAARQATTVDEPTMIEAAPLVLPGALADPSAGPAPEPETQPQPASPPDRERTHADDEPALLPSVLAAIADARDAGDTEDETDRAGDASAPAWRLRVPGHEPESGFRLHEGENRVGRLPDAEVRIDSLDVSRLHAVLTVRGDRLTVRDAGSRNRTWLGGEPVAGEVVVEPGADLRFGGVEATPEAIEGTAAESGPEPADDQTGGGW